MSKKPGTKTAKKPAKKSPRAKAAKKTTVRKAPAKQSSAAPAPRLDKYALYERCVTDPARLIPFLDAVHGGGPATLREDFSGPAPLARAWAARSGRHSAVAVDNDPDPLAHAAAERVRTVCADVLDADDRAEILAATNFPLGYCHTRRDLLTYLKHARGCLRRGGIFVADMYGGSDAFSPLSLTQKLKGPASEAIEYTWTQKEADHLTNRVIDTLSFKVTPRGKGAKAYTLNDAFVYDWRLWSIPELTDAMHDAGFSAVEVYSDLGDAIDQDGNLLVRPVEPGELDDNFVVYFVGRR